MATNYSRGRSFEYQVRNHLLKDGFVCIRSAGSKGSIDLIAGREGVVLAVQCKKNGRIPASERRRLRQDASQFGAIPVLAEQSRGVVFYEVKRLGTIKSKVNIMSTRDDHG